MLILLLFLPLVLGQQSWVPCSELNDDLRYPCKCRVQVDRALQLRILMNCDRVVFPGDFPPLPYGAPIVSFSQQWAGQQSLPTQVYLMITLCDINPLSICCPLKVTTSIQNKTKYTKLHCNNSLLFIIITRRLINDRICESCCIQLN